ncbi:hypothetical protein ACRAWF_28590 [Streptomyces sp. L7]
MPRLATIALTGASAIPADAAETTVAAAKATGSDSCFNYSYDPGTVSTTVYFHNTCNHTRIIYLHWFLTNDQILVKAHAKGHKKRDQKIMTVTDFGDGYP